MNPFRLLVLVAAFLPSVNEAAVNAITSNFATGAANAGLTNPIVFLGGPSAPAGAGMIAVGIFGSTDAQISAVGGNPAAWSTVAATSTHFGASATIGTGAGAAPGTAGLFSITPAANVTGTPFSGKNVYIAIGSGATLAASTNWVVFKSNTTFADEPTPSVNAFLADAAPGQLPDGQLLLGFYGTPHVYYTTGPLANQTLTAIADCGLEASEVCPIPEPTSALLAALGLGFTLIRRRAPRSS